MNNNKKIAYNSLIIFFRLCITSLIGVFSSRIVLDALGASDYGLYNVVGGIVVVLNVFNTAMISTTYRFIAYELGKGTQGNPNRVFNASFVIHASFAVLILFLGIVVGEWYIDNYLNFDVERIYDAKFVFRFSVLTTVITTLFVPYQGLLVAYEKFNITAIVDIVTQLLRFILLVLLIYNMKDRIRFYSILQFSYMFVHSVILWIYCRFHYQKIIKFVIVRDRHLYNKMISFSGWILVGASASVCKTQGSTIIVNYFFGTIVNAAFAIAKQVENFILMFARCLNNAAIPQITKSFSSGDKERSVNLASYISKYTFFLMLVVSFPVVLDLDFLLGLWLKEVPNGTALYCNLIIIGALLDCLGEGLPALIQATGKIKVFQLVLSVFMLLGLPVAFAMYKLGCPPSTILIIYALISLISAFLRIYLMKRVLDFDVLLFLRTSYLRIFYVCVPLVVVYFVYNPSHFSFGEHIVGLIASELVLGLVILLLGTDDKEKRIIKSKLGDIVLKTYGNK